MPCCGKKRAQARQTTQTRSERDSPAYFQYLGKTGLTVIGSRTRQRYRFDRPGAVVAVDPRDRRALVDVPTLRQVRKPTNVAKESRVLEQSTSRA
jgi:hypothetical protein